MYNVSFLLYYLHTDVRPHERNEMIRIRTKDALDWFIEQNKGMHHGVRTQIGNVCGVSRVATHYWGEYVPVAHTKELLNYSNNKIKTVNVQE